ncbi:MAG TPA: triose-phosphate isomerase [Candidatus Paceibacterota bacterium]|nr:triose-phosphate isomerase [Candidatus Paceibacterota bacterium]
MIIAANWKAYVEEYARAKKLVAIAKRRARDLNGSVILAPPAPFLGAFAPGNRSAIAFAAQDVSLTTGGAHTGEATAQAYAAAGATYAIVGHSERRAAGDTDAVVAEKLAHAHAHELTPILCIGERERDSEGRYLSFIREELTAALDSRSQKERARIIVAYEPIWAIGKTAADAIAATDLAEMVAYIRKVLGELLPGKGAERVPILYGGSVEPANARDLAASTGIDGFLVGHVSADPDSFAALLRQFS